VLSFDDFKNADETLFKNQLQGLVQGIVAKRNHYASATAYDNPCQLTKDQRDVLLRTGWVKFNLVSDMGLYTFDLPRARIKTIELNKFAVQTDGPSLRLEVDFWHSGQSVLRDAGKQGVYYSFEQNQEDDPISWRFVCTTDPNRGLPMVIHGGKKVDGGEGEQDELLKEALKDLKFREYWPGLFSDVTLWLHKGHYEAVRKKIQSIDAVEFTVSVVYGV
jgi:hypothetical protein